jgi:hypothetical protein
VPLEELLVDGDVLQGDDANVMLELDDSIEQQ